MVLEVDIILGQTENSMKYLEIDSLNKKNNKGEMNDNKNSQERKKSFSKEFDSTKNITVQALNDKPTVHSGDTNKLKINAIERDI